MIEYLSINLVLYSHTPNEESDSWQIVIAQLTSFLESQDLELHRSPVLSWQIGLKKYLCSLYNAVESGVILQCDIFLDGILEGLLFLHTLGFVHNDINLTNIMLDNKGMPVIIDFDSCI